MKALLLAGGYGTRLSEETGLRPKPMIEIGGKPILWHIMKLYSAHRVNDFVICCGYKGYMIKEYFANYFLHMSDVTFDMSNNQMKVHHQKTEPWKVTLVDTGEDTLTGGRLKRVAEYVKDEESFCFTYGDGIAMLIFPRKSTSTKDMENRRPSWLFSLPVAMELWSLKAARFWDSPKNPRAMVASSTEGSSFFPPSVSTSSLAINPAGKGNLWLHLLKRDN